MFAPLLPNERVRAVALIALLAALVVRGILPTFDGIDTDFPNYYTAGSIARTGIDVDRLYDDAWFQEQIHARGMSQEGKFSPYPPATALLFIPFSFVSPESAFAAMTVLNLILLVAAIPLLARAVPAHPKDVLLLLLFAGIGLANNLRFGQMYIAVSLSIIAGYMLARTGHQLLGGLCLGIFIPIKYFPLVFLVVHVLRGEWRVLAGAVLSSVFITLVGIAVLGTEVHRQFLTGVMGGHLSADLSLQNPFSASFQSIDVFLKRLFVLDPLRNPAPLFSAPFLVPVLKTLLSFLVGAAVVRFVWRTRHSASPLAYACAYVLPGIGAMLLAPATATYHWVLLWLPAGLLLAATAGTPGVRTVYWTAVVSYAVTGFIPYRFTSVFDGSGPGVLLAYPRLLMTILLFAAAIGAAQRLVPTTTGPRAERA